MVRVMMPLFLYIHLLMLLCLFNQLLLLLHHTSSHHLPASTSTVFYPTAIDNIVVAIQNTTVQLFHYVSKYILLQKNGPPEKP